MKFYNLCFIIFFALTYNKVTSKEIKCPSHCLCDIFENYRKASCQNRNLITVEADIPSQAQLLDLSYNLIYELHDRIFVELQLNELLLLNVSHNKISRIHIHAFTGMENLLTLDLSYNNLEYVLKNWFWNTSSLQELYLRGNNFGKLDEVFVESSSIKVLDVSACSILYINDQALSELPQLEVLDLSDNYLIQLRVEIFKPCPKLKIINVENNNLSCNQVFDSFMEYCKSNEIRVTNTCIKTKLVNQKKFEKIITAVEDYERNSWLYDDATDNTEKPTICNCKATTENSIFSGIFLGLPVFVLLITFCVGIGLGLIIAYSVNTRKPKRPRRRRKKLVRTRPMSDIYIALTSDFEVSNTTPMPVRKEMSG